MVVDQSMNKEKMPDFAMMVSGYCGYKQTILLIHFAVKTIDKRQTEFFIYDDPTSCGHQILRIADGLLLQCWLGMGC
jgi:hypothetical protein